MRRARNATKMPREADFPSPGDERRNRNCASTRPSLASQPKPDRICEGLLINDVREVSTGQNSYFVQWHKVKRRSGRFQTPYLTRKSLIHSWFTLPPKINTLRENATAKTTESNSVVGGSKLAVARKLFINSHFNKSLKTGDSLEKCGRWNTVVGGSTPSVPRKLLILLALL